MDTINANDAVFTNRIAKLLPNSIITNQKDKDNATSSSKRFFYLSFSGDNENYTDDISSSSISSPSVSLPNTSKIPTELPFEQLQSSDGFQNDELKKREQILLQKMKENLKLISHVNEINCRKNANDDTHSMPMFTGEHPNQIKRWLYEYESMIEQLNGNDDDKLRLTHRFLDGNAKKFVQFKFYEKWLEAKNDLENEFDTKMPSFFFIISYVIVLSVPTRVLCVIFTKCQYHGHLSGIHETVLIPFIIRGLNDGENSNMLYAALLIYLKI